MGTLFYAWWLLIDGFIYYSEYNFLLHFSNTHNRQYLYHYIGINAALTFFVIYFHWFSVLRLVVHMLFFLWTAFFLLHISWMEAAAAAVISLTLSTFMEGFSTVFMQFLAARILTEELGLLVHVLLTVALSILYFAALRLIAARYRLTAPQAISSYLYILLLPCTLIVWTVRYVFQLDSHDYSQNLYLYMGGASLWALVWLFGALLVFVVLMKVFYRIVTLSRQELEREALTEQLKNQQVYIEEAKMRNEQYRSFQHDIKNHLLVLSGLLGEHQYKEADTYLEKLNLASNSLLSPVSTGNTVLDVLLGEKINYAKQNDIQVTCEVQLPECFYVDDMDLCIIFSNALDNAIQACRQIEREKRRITVTVKTRHHFMMIEVINTGKDSLTPKPGTGLKNIRQTAERYGGTLEMDQENGVFRTSILLCGRQEPLFTNYN